MKYVYLCQQRPPQSGAVPKDGLLCFEYNDIGRYGEVVYSRRLTSEEIQLYELTPYCTDNYTCCTTEKVADKIITGNRASLNLSSSLPLLEYFFQFDEKGNLDVPDNNSNMQLHYPVDLYNAYLSKNFSKVSEAQLMDNFRKIEQKFADKTNLQFMKICKDIADQINTKLEEYWY